MLQITVIKFSGCTRTNCSLRSARRRLRREKFGIVFAAEFTEKCLENDFWLNLNVYVLIMMIFIFIRTGNTCKMLLKGR